jgi:hypothetical protein
MREGLVVENGRAVGFCGMVCSDCPEYKATQKNSGTERKRVAELFAKQYVQEYKSEDFNCDGCTNDGKRIFSFCQVCKIRECGREKGIKNCAFCEKYPLREALRSV